MLGWGLYELLGVAVRRRMLEMHSVMKYAVNALVDTLAVRLDHATCNHQQHCSSC